VTGGGRDWVAWHEPYEVAGTALAGRLAIVQRLIAEAIESRPGPIRVISACAGQGRDLLGALAHSPRRADVSGRLVELDLTNAAAARAAASDLPGIEVVTGDASVTDAYAGAVPADLVMLCGIFGNVSEADVERTIALAPTLCAPGATVIWTRHRKPPDLTPAIDGWFEAAGFERLTIESIDGHPWVGVGAHRLRGAGCPFQRGVRLFTFTS
jgi:hypothetical protein